MTYEKQIMIVLVFLLLLIGTMGVLVYSLASPAMREQYSPGSHVTVTLSPTAANTAVATRTPTPTPTPAATVFAPASCSVSTGFANGRLNVRACPGLDCAILGIVREGETLTVTASGDWLSVQFANLRGWVNSEYTNCERR